MSLEDRTCLVTGASKGIGAGIAEEFGREGANVIVNYRSSEDAAYEVRDTVEDLGGSAIVAQANVANKDEVEAMYEASTDEFGQIDVLVNNAGITVDKKFENMTREDWDRVVDVNLGGVYNCTKVCFEDIRNAHEGRLVNISSVVGQEGNIGQANYASTKSGLFGFTRTIALELAHEGSTANCVAPGFVKTDMLAHVPDRVKENILKRIPLDRFAEVEDITGMVRFLAAEESSYMTGQVLGVNGGMEW
ncbi:MAG: 3-oxoacyl-[acyl-carrier protein] reductase [Haloarculaceae archaeon]|jgi:3-oxoacyl-[acyl-carrier protein] reductase